MSDKPEDRVEDIEDTETEEVEEKEQEIEEAEDKVEEAEEAVKASGSKETYTKAEFDKAVKRRQTALDEKRALAKELAELKKQHATKEQRIQLEAEERAKEQADRFKPALVQSHLAYEMAFLGLNKSQIGQIVKFVEMDNIDVDLNDNSVEGVEGEVARIRELFPDLFPSDEETPAAKAAAKKAAPKKRVPKVDGADKPPPPKPSTARDKLKARLYKG